MDVLKTGYLFFQNQILGMQWLNTLIANFLSALGLEVKATLGGSINSFIYDTIKITILLCVLIFIIFLALFIVICAVGIVIIGYLFNALQAFLV